MKKRLPLFCGFSCETRGPLLGSLEMGGPIDVIKASLNPTQIEYISQIIISETPEPIEKL